MGGSVEGWMISRTIRFGWDNHPSYRLVWFVEVCLVHPCLEMVDFRMVEVLFVSFACRWFVLSRNHINLFTLSSPFFYLFSPTPYCITSSSSFLLCVYSYNSILIHVPKFKIQPQTSISEIRLESHLAVESSSNSNYGSRGALAWTPPASVEGSTPTWTEGTPSFTESSSSGDIGSEY